MFERYRKETDALRLSDEATDRILKALAAPPKAAHTPRIRWIVACAACVALILTAALLPFGEKPTLSRYPEDKDTPTVSVTAQGEHLTYAETFALLQSIHDTVDGGDMEFAPEYDGNVLPGGSPTQATTTAQMMQNNQADTTTNTQYTDVDEADLVKAQDGYIYALNRATDEVTVYRADGENTAEVAKRTPTDRDDSFLLNMYLTDDRLVVLYTQHEIMYSDSTTEAGDAVMPEGNTVSTTTVCFFTGCYSYMNSRIYAKVYDISDPTDPRPLTEYGQDGTLIDSRMVGNVLYLVTRHSVYALDESDPTSYVPVLYHDGQATPVAEDALIAAATPDEANYALITAVSVEGETARRSEKAVLGAGYASLWMNTEQMMLMQRGYREESRDTPLANGAVLRQYESHAVTDLTLLTLNGGDLAVTAHTAVDGESDGQFSLDAWDDHFRIAVTCTYCYNEYAVVTDEDSGTESYDYRESRSEQYNRLYVLDSTLQEVGRIDNMAPGETVRSVRFDGAIGYVVTFRQTDPLFAIDLSDPTSPTVLSALKITGFSEYLHPFGENRLLGFGYAGTEDGLNGRLKLTMFDTTDKTDVTLKTFLELPDTFYYSDALEDHHAILADAARGVVGMPFFVDGGWSYVLYRYTEADGFSPLVQLNTSSAEYLRGLFIDDRFYLVYTDGITVYDSDLTYLTAI